MTRREEVERDRLLWVGHGALDTMGVDEGRNHYRWLHAACVHHTALYGLHPRLSACPPSVGAWAWGCQDGHAAKGQSETRCVR